MVLAFAASLLLLFYFLFPSEMIAIGKESLLIWYNNILPVLFPSMLIAGLLFPWLSRMDCDTPFLKKTAGILGIPAKGLLAVIPGFLCGFPMGAFLCRKLLDDQEITLPQAQRILSFSNNIGPVYFLSVIAAGYPFPWKIFWTALFYAVPLLYAAGRNRIRKPGGEALAQSTGEEKPKRPDAPARTALEWFQILDESINTSISAIVRLCGYIFVSRSVLILPLLLQKAVKGLPGSVLCYLNALIEVTSGIAQLKKLDLPQVPLTFLELPFLAFGGFCCAAQTACMISGSRLSLGKYLIAKTVQSLLAALLGFAACRLYLALRVN